MGRYDVWVSLFDGRVESFRVSFDELENLTGRPLPPSATSHPEWWANTAGNPQAIWVRIGWVAEEVDRDGRVVMFRHGAAATRAASPRTPVRRGRARVLDGDAALEQFVASAGYPSVAHALAAHCVFLHPETVAQTHGRAVVPVVRDARRRGEVATLPDGRRVVYCDNATPTEVFLWAADRVKGRDVQFNHVWTCSLDPDAYTALWNICCTPAFLAKTTDTHVEVKALLKYRAWDLYGHVPAGESAPQQPDGYDSYEWAAMPAPLPDLEATFRARMDAAPAKGAVTAAREIGWCFSEGPDQTAGFRG